MIGYKATYNGKCKERLYEVGKTYILKGELIMCKNGFHFCQDLFDVFYYYTPDKYLKVFKVEALGNIETERDKSVTDKIKILEEVSLANLILEKNCTKRYFDDKCNYIKIEYSYGSWIKHEYDENNNLIKREDSDGYWAKWEYNSKDNIVKYENSKGYLIEYQYDENNNLIKREDSDGYLSKWEYNK
ncbi:RHS repeat protein [Candidatus Gracilibacteria bacterium]|nr:RHS repeat protein [Candidatus Gracilibacteria bacterium]